ncbi:MAG TPA: ATP-binding protein [Polyangiaceae bacterium]
MDLLAIVLAATAGIELLAALLFAVGVARRSADTEQGVAALLCLAAAEHAVGSLLEARATNASAALAADRVAWLGLIVLLPLAIHFALGYRGVRPAWRSLAVPYALAFGFATLDVRGALHANGAGARASGLLVGTADAVHRVGPLGPAGVAAYFGAVVAAGAVLVIIARAYLAGRREALAVVVGATVLLATVINDVGVASGAFTTGYLVDAGIAAFVVGIATTPSARYAFVSVELERRTRELRTRTRELRRSYEELRTAQEELVKKEQLAVVGELAAVIAHEVRNPLAIISNAVAGLRKQAISREDHVTLLTILDEETNRLNRLVTDLLRYARPVNIQRQQFSLADLLSRTLGLVNTDQSHIKIELKVECHEGRIWGDSNLLRQVFDNLIDNGVQAMGTAGTLTVRIRAVTEEGVDGLAVDIIDTGEGMDTQVRSRARDPFFTTRPSGTGLGLAIVDRIVDAHGGHFAIDSRSGEGTTVTVFLPHGSPSEPPPPRTRAPKAPSDPPRSTPAAG